MNILIVDNNTSYINSLKSLLTNHNKKIISFKNIKNHNLNDYQLIILTGGHPNSVVYQHQLYEEEIKAILRSDAAILGICLGFELIVHAFGGKLKELPEKEKGILQIEIIKQDPIFNGINKIKVFESHRWIAEELPKDLIPLAKSKDGIEILKHSTKNIYGFQFHPEIVESEEDLKIFNNLINLTFK